MAIYRDKFQLAADLLKKHDYDCWMIVGHESATNSEPVLSSLGDFEFIGLTAIIITKENKKTVICTPLDANGYLSLNLFDEVIAFPISFNLTLKDYLEATLPKTIALNYSLNNPASDGLSYGMFQVLKDTFDQLSYRPEIVSAEPIVNEVRGVKTATEIEKITQAALAAQAIFEKAKSFIKAGVTCAEVANFFQNEADKLGYGYAWPKTFNPGVSAGAKAPSGHMAALDLKIEKGDLVNVDFGVTIDGYSCDLQRMYYVLDDHETAAPSDIQTAFDDVRTAIALAAEALVPNVTGFAVDKVARDYILEKGYGDWNAALGHQLGRVAHDGGPLLAPEKPRYNRPELIHTPLSENYVFTLEPGVMTRSGRIGIEENVVVKAGGAQFLIPPQAELYLIGKDV